MADKPKVPADKGGNAYVNPFRTCDKNGKPVPFRFDSPKALRDVFTKACTDDEKDAVRRTRIRGMYDCRQPWDPAKLKAAGMGNKANFPSTELKGILDARAGAVTELALDNVDLIDLRPMAVEKAGPDADEIGLAVSEEFSAVLRSCSNFLPALATSVLECDLTGFGPVMWPDPDGWEPVALKRAQVKLYENAPAMAAMNEIIMVESTLPASYVFGLFDNPEESEAAGWKLDALRAYAVQVFYEGQDATTQSGNDDQTSVIESRLAQMRENRLFETKQFFDLTVVHAFVKETSGSRKVTHYMIPGKEDMDRWLMVLPDAYDTIDQAVNWIPASVTSTRANGLRGIASFLCARLDIANRAECEALDAVRAAMKIHITRPVGSSGKMTISEQGPYAVFPDGVQPMNSPQVIQGVQQAISVTRLGVQSSAANAAGIPGPLGVPSAVVSGTDRKTKEEVALERERGAKAEQGLFISRVLVFDRIFRECFRRFIKIVNSEDYASDAGASQFVRRCKLRGIGRDKLRAVPDIYEAYTNRFLAVGGAGAHANLLREILGDFGGNLDEHGRIEATHDFIKARMGASAAERYRPKIGRDDIPSDAASHAQQENNNMLELAPALAAPDQMHWSHIPVHGRLVQQIVDAVNNGQVEDPQRLLDMLGLVSSHIQSHIEFGGRQLGKERDAKMALADLRSLRPVQQSLIMMAATIDRSRRAQEEKAQREMEALQNRADGKDNAVKMHDIDMKAALKMREQDMMHEARMAQASSKAQTDAFRAKAKAELDRISANYRRYVGAGRITVNPPPETTNLIPEEPAVGLPPPEV